jgi:uncharacterized membrane protein YqjE
VNRPAEESTTGVRGNGGDGSTKPREFGPTGPEGEPIEGREGYTPEEERIGTRAAYGRGEEPLGAGEGYREGEEPFGREGYERGAGPAPFGARPGYRPGQDKVFPLIRRIADEVTTLFTKELALLRVELTSALKDTRTGIGAMATGGAVLYAGFLMLLLSAVFGLALVMEAWLAALIVGVVVLIIGAIMLSVGKRKLDADTFKPEHTTASLRKDRDMIKRNIQHESYNR